LHCGQGLILCQSEDSTGDEGVGVGRGVQGAAQVPDNGSDETESDVTIHQESSPTAAQRRVPVITHSVGPSGSKASMYQSEGQSLSPRRGANPDLEPDHFVDIVQETSKATSPMSQRETAESSGSSFLISAPQRTVPTEIDQDIWKLHYNNPPLSSISKQLMRAYSWSDLQRRLQLDEETVRNERLTQVVIL
jgi:hypothetical protein